MAETPMMRADMLADGFNSVVEREYWRATIAGTRERPEVNFNSRASMVVITFHVETGLFTVAFSQTSTTFGDFLASVYRCHAQVMTALVAAGLPFDMPTEDPGVLRVEYHPGSKRATIHLARLGSSWNEAEPLPFKVPERENEESIIPGIDGP